MLFFNDQRGVSALSLILLGLLALSVVLLNGTAITLKGKEKARLQQGRKVAVSYCTKSNPIFPVECKVTKVYKCNGGYLLRTGCIGVGDIILNEEGGFVKWCGYTSLEGAEIDCGQYWLDSNGNDCTKTNNLCL